MKSLNIKIPLPIAQQMNDKAQLNAHYLEQFITEYMYHSQGVTFDKPLAELTYTYTFKVHDSIHKMLKLEAIERDLPMNELIGRLIAMYYR